LFECDTEREDFKYSTAEASFQLSPGSPPLSLELIPTELIPHYGNVHRNTAPQPSPLPTLARDDQLSYISLMEKQSTTYHPLNNSSDPMQATLCSVPSISSQPPVVFTGTRKPDTCHYPVEKEHQLDIQKNPTADRATNTGRSLLSLDDSGEVSIPNRVLPLHEEASGEVTTLCGEVSTTLPEEVSIKTVTDSSVLASGLINLDLCSFGKVSVVLACDSRVFIQLQAVRLSLVVTRCTFTKTCWLVWRSCYKPLWRWNSHRVIAANV
jgi:hypothetical protein